MTREIHLRDIYIILIPLLLLLSMFPGFPLGSNLDEAAALLGLLSLLNGLRSRRVREAIGYELVMLCGMLFLALASNLIFGVVRTPSYILNDMFSFSRIFLVYLGTIAFFELYPGSIHRVLRALGGASGAFIVACFTCGVLNLVGVVDMYNSVRFGIRTFSFVFGNASQFGVFVGAALGLYVISGHTGRLVEMMGIIVLFMTAKGTSLIIALIYVLLDLLLRGKIKWWHIALAGLGLIFALRYQIETYILNASAPRALLIYYGLVTSVTYFPLGAGFATYGSNMAAVHYSPLYYRYGFDQRKSLGEIDPLTGAGVYLNDTYLGMIFGEFGFIGTVLFGGFFFRVWRKINATRPFRPKSKQITVALFVCLCGSFVMLGSIKNAPGLILLFTIASYIALENHFVSKLKIVEKKS